MENYHRKLSRARIVVGVLGLIQIGSGVFFPEIITLIEPHFPSFIWFWDMLHLYMLAIQIIVGVGGILVIIGSILLPSQVKWGRILIIIGAIPATKDLGLITILVCLLMTRNLKAN